MMHSWTLIKSLAVAGTLIFHYRTHEKLHFTDLIRQMHGQLKASRRDLTAKERINLEQERS